jgi:hypothetical protein
MTEQELYQQYLKETGGSAPDEQALYQQYLAETGQDDKVMDETHPDVSFLSRLMYKNLGNSADNGVDYLKRENPNLEFRNRDGEIQVKAPGEKEWKMLDSSSLEWQDATDLLYDIPTGIAQGVGSAAAGFSAGAGSGGTLTVPAAMAASGAIGTGVESLRQGLGQFFGVNKDVNLQDVAMAGGIGTVLPGVFGGGGTANQAAKQALKSGVSQKMLLDSQRGLIGRTVDTLGGNTARGLMSLISGESAPIMKTMYENLDEIKYADKNPSTRVGAIESIKEKTTAGLKNETRKVGSEIGALENLIDEKSIPEGLAVAGEKAKTIPTLPRNKILEPFENLVQSLNETYVGTPGEIEDLKNLKSLLDKEILTLPENMTAKQLKGVKNRLRGLAQKYGMNYGNRGGTTSTLEGASVLDSKIASAFEEASQNVNDIFIDRLDKIGDGYGNQYKNLQDLYGTLKDVAKETKKDFKSTKATSNFLTRATKNAVDEQNLMDLERVTGVNLSDAAKKEEAFRVYTKPSTDIRSVQGSTSTTRSTPLQTGAGLAAYNIRGGSGDRYFWQILAQNAASKLVSPAAIRNYATGIRAGRTLPEKAPFVWTPQVIKNMTRGDSEE